jgi:transposase
MGFIKADRTQHDLFGYRISDFAKSDAKSRFIIDIISRLDLAALFQRYSDQGGESYSPDMMLCLWFYAYSNGETSTRKLEELCRYDTRYIYISCNLKPDHTTLSRFRKTHLDLLSDYFLQILQLAEEEGVTDLRHISIDGTKLQAASSKKNSYKEDQLDRRIEALRKDIVGYMQRCAFVEQGAGDEIDLEVLQQEKKRLEALERKLLERRQQLQERKKTINPEFRKNHRINTIEPQARSMSQVNGPGYNGQLAVDCQTNIIVANDVSDHPHDKYLFKDMHQKTEKNLPCDNNRSYTADAGYHSLDQLEYVDERNIDAIIADQKPFDRSTQSRPTAVQTIEYEDRKVQRQDFVYHRDKNYYECPAGDKLYPVSNTKKGIVYQANKCAHCPIASKCITNKKGIKQINRDHREELAEKMSRKLAEGSAKLRMKQRATSVEPVFGNLKQNLGFRRFNLMDLIQVKGEFNLMCIAHNLNTIFKLVTAKRFAALAFVYQVKFNQFVVISKNVAAIFFNKLIEKIFSTHRRKYGLIY